MLTTKKTLLESSPLSKRNSKMFCVGIPREMEDTSIALECAMD